MKIIIIALISLFIFTAANAQDNAVRRVDVTGTSIIKVKPDMLHWSVSAQYEANELSEIKRAIDRATEDVIDMLRRAGVKEEDIQTSGIMVYKNYLDPNNPNVKRFNGSNSISFVLRDISKYSDLSESFFDIENVFTSSPAFDYSGKVETRERAREDALLAARKKAEDMARVMGVTLGRVYAIEEQPDTYYTPVYNSMERMESSYQNSGVFSEGQINIEARVRVIYELQ